MNVNHFLVDYRMQNQLTQHDLASQIGINSAVLSRLERNIGNRTVRRVLTWCETHKINPSDIFPPEASA